MTAPPTLPLALLGMIVLASLAPVASAQAAPLPAPGGLPIVNLYVSGDALGGAMSPEPPSASTATTKSVISTATTPALGFYVTLGSFTPVTELVPTTDVIASAWLSAATAMPYSQICLYFSRAGTDLGTGCTPQDSPGTLDTTPLRVSRSVAQRGATLAAGTRYDFRIIVFGASGATTPTDVLVHYGSTTTPTGLVFGAVTDGGLGSQSVSTGIYLAEGALSLEAPSAPADLSRTAPTAAGSAAQSAEFSWGTKVKTTTPLTVTGPSVFTIWVSLSGNAGAVRGLSATAVFGAASESQTRGNFAAAFQSASGAAGINRYSFSLDTAGMSIPAQTEIDIKLQILTTSESLAGTIVFLYGSQGRPAGLSIPALPVPESVSVSGSPLSQTVVPGATALYTVSVKNEGAAALEYALNATGLPAGVNVAFDAANGTLDANATQTHAVRVAVPIDAPDGSFPLVVLVAGARGGADNVSLTLVVQREEVPPATGPTDGQQPPADDAGGSTDGAPPAGGNSTDNAGGKKSGGIPSSGLLPGLFVALAALVLLARRRPKG